MNETLRNKGWEQMNALLNKQEKPRYRYAYIPYAAALMLCCFSVYMHHNSSKLAAVDYEAINIYNIPNQSWKQTNDSDQNILQSNNTYRTTSNRESQSNTPIILSDSGNPMDKQFQEIHVSPLKKDTKQISVNISHTTNTDTDFPLPNNQSITVHKQDPVKTKDSKTNNLVSNYEEDNHYVLMSSEEIEKTFKEKKNKPELHGSLGFVSQNGENYGLRAGVEIEKPITNKLSVHTGVRYSRYIDQYGSTYDLKQSNYSYASIIQELEQRNVQRSFIEMPVYSQLELAKNLRIKAGAVITYNNNESSSAQDLLTQHQTTNFSSTFQDELSERIGDKKGYLGEAVIGAQMKFDKIAVDVEGTYGVISNQNITGRSVVGARISYQFGK